MALKGAVFSMSGALSKTRAAIAKDIKNNGGEFSANVTGKVTILLCPPDEFMMGTEKICIAKGKGIPMCHEDLVWDSIKAGKLLPIDKYNHDKSTSAPVSHAPPPVSHAPPAKKPRTAAAAGGPEVNSRSGREASHTVVSHGGKFLDAEMVQQDAASNMDKFYDIQVLGGSDYYCFQHWGRAGTLGQTKEDGPFDSEDAAYKMFLKKFREKSGYAFESDTYAPAKPGKYTVVERMAAVDRSVKWEYQVEKPVDGKKPGWYPYDAGATANMERYFAQFASNEWLHIRYVHSGTYTYKVDFRAMRQTNVDHPAHTTRNIRRKA